MVRRISADSAVRYEAEFDALGCHAWDEEAMVEPMIDLELVKHGRTGEIRVIAVARGWSTSGVLDTVGVSRHAVDPASDWWSIRDEDMDTYWGSPEVAWAQVQPWITVAVHLEVV